MTLEKFKEATPDGAKTDKYYWSFWEHIINSAYEQGNLQYMLEEIEEIMKKKELGKKIMSGF